MISAKTLHSSPFADDAHTAPPGVQEQGARLDHRTFLRFRDLVYDQAGIWLRDGKEALVCARVGKRMRSLNIQHYADYLDHVLKDSTGGELIRLVDSITTNVTSFFREALHFKILKDLVAKGMEDGQRRFRFWCSACATGEEAYSMAMSIQDALNGQKADVKILATDISTSALETCRLGIYAEERMHHVSEARKLKHFTVSQDPRGAQYTVRPALRDLILFRRLNLSLPPFPMKGPLDAIFCRNVMIYFDVGVRTRLLNEICRLLKPGGTLMVGHAESLAGIATPFKMVRPSVYVKS